MKNAPNASSVVRNDYKNELNHFEVSRSSVSAVSKLIFADKDSLESSWRDLQDVHTSAPLSSQFSKNVSLFAICTTPK